MKGPSREPVERALTLPFGNRDKAIQPQASFGVYSFRKPAMEVSSRAQAHPGDGPFQDGKCYPRFKTTAICPVL